MNDAFVDIENAHFTSNKSEDALNLNQVSGKLQGINISHTKSDGLDADFSEVTLTDSRFTAIGSQTGADAIDISRSTLHAKRLEITNVTDKGVSIGEGSAASFDKLAISDTMVGVVAKDSSRVIVENAAFSRMSLADYMAYNKKAHYSGATIEISNYLNASPTTVVEHGSVVKVDGRPAPTRDLDVDELYSNAMKSIK